MVYWFIGKWSRLWYYAYSTDGLNWTRYSSNDPVLYPGPVWRLGFVARIGPVIIKEDGIYKMYYERMVNINMANWYIGLATSTDGINWTKYQVIQFLSGWGLGYTFRSAIHYQ